MGNFVDKNTVKITKRHAMNEHLNSAPFNQVLSVCVPVPLRQSFDFLPPKSSDTQVKEPSVGARIKVQFGARQLTGVIVEIKNSSDYPLNKLKHAIEIIDDQDLFDDRLWKTLQWVSRYYLAPIGEVVDGAMPVALRQGAPITPASKKTWRLTDHARSAHIDELNRAPLQLAIVKRFMQDPYLYSDDFKDDFSGWRQAVKALVSKGWLTEFTEEPRLNRKKQSNLNTTTISLTEQQTEAATTLDSLIEKDAFSCSLLHGVTGSGKTEVYFSAMDRVLANNKQVLLLVPEIGLTPQLIERIEKRFDHPIVTMHSRLNDTERHLAWWHTKQGNARIVVGTRSAIFSVFESLGLIIVDEEHDASFKQQDGVRYQARDVAVYRANQLAIPIILGSATPSLESYANAQSERYHLLTLNERASKVDLPSVTLFDLNRQPSVDGLSPAMLEAIGETIKRNKQAILFLNRRGFAPVMYCKSCGETSKCHRCDSHLTLHQRINRVRCHHCGYEGRWTKQCHSCKSDQMVEVGEGTQRVEDAITLRFPQASLLRIDRDSTSRKGELESLLEQARDGKADILIGTQLISKGHDFPNVGMVGILEADQGLHSSDFRATESLFQQILQVAGRAGRRDEVGRVYIQTRFPEHPFFDFIKQHNFNDFAQTLLEERKQAHYPPFGYFALLRSESPHQAKALQFLRRAKQDLQAEATVRIMDPIPAPMERRAGRYRAQLLLCSDQRSQLNATLVRWLNHIALDKDAKKLSSSVRWSLDIDPWDHY